MIYLSWAAFYEGSTDRSYYDVLLPRLMEEITRMEGIQEVTIPASPAIHLGGNGRQINQVANEVRNYADAFHLLFIHADRGGRSISATLNSRSIAYCEAAHEACGWNPERCVILAPDHETEAWVMADPEAITEALGYRGAIAGLGLPSNAAEAERLTAPKEILERAVGLIQGRRSRRGGSQLFATIAQTQSINALRGSASFRCFEEKLRSSLVSLGCLSATC